MKHRWFLILIVILSGCAELERGVLVTVPVAPNATKPLALLPVTPSAVATAPIVLQFPTTPPTLLTDPTPTVQIATPLPAPTIQPVAPPANPTFFLLDSVSQSPRDLIQHIALRVDSAEIDPSANTLAFTIAFINQADEPLNLTTSRIADADWRLQDADGHSYQALKIDQQLSNFVPVGGFAPAGATVGKLIFPLPTGAQPYQLILAQSLNYSPLSVQLDRPMSNNLATVSAGEYDIGVDLYSSQAVLAPLILRVERVLIAAETITIDLDFINNQRRGYTVRGVTGSDTWLLGADGQQVQPSIVSPSLATTIAPSDGWTAYGSNQGQLTFPRPADMSEARFIFSGFSPLTLNFGVEGLQSAAITSATGGAPPPTPIPAAEEVALDAINTLLAQQAEALLAGNGDLWAQTFVEIVRPQYANALRRTGAMPLAAVQIEVVNSADISPQIERGVIDDLALQMRFEFAETSENPFLYSVKYDLTRTPSGWLVTAIDFGDALPFWWDIDLVQSDSPHFQLFAAADAGDTLVEFETEAEIAWNLLQAQGLPVDDRYLAYYTATQAEFREQAGGSPRQLGIARSRYQIANGVLTISNRIFYINGQSFADEAVAAVNERQVTVTHELAHLVLGNLTRPFSPPWLTEGAAVFYSGDISAEQRQNLLASPSYSQISLAALTAAPSLGVHDLQGARAAAEYAYSGELYNYLVKTYGKVAVLNFYRSYDNFAGDALQERIPVAVSPEALDSIMRTIAVDLTPQLVEEAFHVSLEQLSADFRIWLEG